MTTRTWTTLSPQDDNRILRRQAACFAAAGRDREAVNAWRRVSTGEDRLPIVHTLTADALVRLGDTGQLVTVLTQSVAEQAGPSPHYRD